MLRRFCADSFKQNVLMRKYLSFRAPFPNAPYDALNYVYQATHNGVMLVDVDYDALSRRKKIRKLIQLPGDILVLINRFTFLEHRSL